jgi:hypothetical protein
MAWLRRAADAPKGDSRLSEVVDDWSNYEYPLLVAIAKRAEQSQEFMSVSSDNILDEVVTSDMADQRYKFERALVRLTKYGYVESLSGSWGKPYPMAIHGITERGLRAVGVWPSPDSVVDSLLHQLEKEANDIAVSQPEKSKKLQEVVGFLATGAREVVVSVVTGVAKQWAGLP